MQLEKERALKEQALRKKKEAEEQHEGLDQARREKAMREVAGAEAQKQQATDNPQVTKVGVHAAFNLGLSFCLAVLCCVDCICWLMCFHAMHAAVCSGVSGEWGREARGAGGGKD